MFTNKQIMLFILIWTSTHYAMENNSMTPIKTWDDAKQFAGQVVTFSDLAKNETTTKIPPLS